MNQAELYVKHQHDDDFVSTVPPGALHFDFDDKSSVYWNFDDQVWKVKRPEMPNCYGAQPLITSHLYAERECNTCPEQVKCLSATEGRLTWVKKVSDEGLGVVGLKTDANKPRWSLLPFGSILQVIDVLEFGAKKYRENNWMHVENHRQRYYDAVMRHVEAWWRGEKVDPESKLPHLAHAACCILFLMWFDNNEPPDYAKLLRGET